MLPTYKYKIFFLNPTESSDQSINSLMSLLDDGYEIYNTTVVDRLVVYIIRKEQ